MIRHPEFMERVERLRQIERGVRKAKRDPLANFFVEPSLDEFDNLQKLNFELLMQLAYNCELKYIYFARSEICGCEGKRVPSTVDHDNWCGSGRPVPWYITDVIGVSSCGNSDQHQINELEIAISPDKYGSWNVIERRKLTREEEHFLKFNKVTSRDGNNDRYAYEIFEPRKFLGIDK